MTDNRAGRCTCNEDGYAPDCPQAFIQNGRVLHTLDPDSRLKPRRYISQGEREESDEETAESQSIIASLQEQLARLRASNDPAPLSTGTNRLLAGAPDATISYPGSAPLGGEGVHGQQRLTGYADGDGLRLSGGLSMNRFQPLALNGTSMTQATIGGYSLDMKQLSKRAAEVIPLPPIALPLIFMDSDLNFYHHFFQGLEISAGRSFIDWIAKAGTYSAKDQGHIGPLIEKLMTEGHKQGDPELLVFVKRVVTTTFDLVKSGNGAREDFLILVASNFYGFQYIECGMQCKEPDLKMWLHTAYVHYRLIWFNTFKSAGIPSFALQGVQDRYELPLRNVQAHVPPEDQIESNREVVQSNPARERRAERRRAQRHHEPPPAYREENTGRRGRLSDMFMSGR